MTRLWDSRGALTEAGRTVFLQATRDTPDDHDILTRAAAILSARADTLDDEDRNESWHWRQQLRAAASVCEDMAG